MSAAIAESRRAEAQERSIRMREKSPNPIDIHVGKRVRMRRLMLRMTDRNSRKLNSIPYSTKIASVHCAIDNKIHGGRTIRRALLK